MSLSRDSIQGFIDGYLKAGGDATKIQDNVVDWMTNHPLYPQNDQQKAAILSDLESYRGVIQPKPIDLTPVEEAPPV